MSKELWLEATKSVETGDYPLLGQELSEAKSSPTLNWGIRLILSQPYEGERLAALSEDVAEVSFSLPEEGAKIESSVLAHRVGQEIRVQPDLKLLANIAEIRRLRSVHQDIETWTLVSAPAESDDPEALVGESIRLLTGLLGGCNILELQQGQEESFSTFWGRLGAARLLATEAELTQVPDTLSGAGLFHDLEKNLHKTSTAG